MYCIDQQGQVNEMGVAFSSELYALINKGGLNCCFLQQVLVLDEPTSGLDSTSGLRVVAALQQAARERQLTVVAVLHQPRYEIFNCFDR